MSTESYFRKQPPRILKGIYLANAKPSSAWVADVRALVTGVECHTPTDLIASCETQQVDLADATKSLASLFVLDEQEPSIDEVVDATMAAITEPEDTMVALLNGEEETPGVESRQERLVKTLSSKGARVFTSLDDLANDIAKRLA